MFRKLWIVLIVVCMLAPMVQASAAEAPVKIRVEVFDRNNAPEGQGTAIENKWTDYIKKRALEEINVEVEFVACPRAEETTKLNIWMASQSAPDIVFTYDFDTMYSYADMGGILDVTPYLEAEGSTLKQTFETSLPWGVYKGKQYAVPTLQPTWGGCTLLYVRQDWLDTLGMQAPTSPQELYDMLKAFKEKDPGNVGKDKVVPYALPAPGVAGTQGFYLDFLTMHGVEFDGPYLKCLPTGNYEDGAFHSPVDNGYAKDGYAFLNRLYKEGLIDAEFATDTNGARYDQQVYSGFAGLVNVNPQTPNAPTNINAQTRKAVPEANWVPVKPFANTKGEILMQGQRLGGLLCMIPASSKVPEAALAYLEWMASSDISFVLGHGFAGEHHNMVDGAISYIDTAYNATDLMWIGGDLSIAKATNCWITTDMLPVMYPGEEGLKFQEAMIWSSTYGTPYTVITEPRPNTLSNSATLQDYIFQGAAKVIVASDFEAEYKNYVDGWNKLGGDAYDTEITEALKIMYGE